MISALRRKAAESNTTFRGVHVIRDPLALVVTGYEDVLSVRLEDLMRSSDDYDRTTAAIWNHTIGDMSTPYLLKRLRNASIKGDLRRNPLAERGSEKLEGDFLFGHVADAEMKQKAMQALKTIPPPHMEALLRARTRLGYPEPQ